jgi:folate-binding protein YgfZ
VPKKNASGKSYFAKTCRLIPIVPKNLMTVSLHTADIRASYHLLRIGGADRIHFLQGLVTQDVATVTPEMGRFSALLNSAGRFIADMLLLSDGDNLYLRVAASQSGAILQRLSLYKLRSKVDLTLITDSFCQVSWSETGGDVANLFGLPSQPGSCHSNTAAGWCLVDPRHAGLGVLQISLAGQQPLPHPFPTERRDADDYRYHQLGLGIPEGATDLEAERSVILEYGYDAMGALSWSKGCYIGQELMARTHHRGQVRKALLPACLLLPNADTAPPPPGCPVLAGAEEVGEWRGGLRDRGLILVKQDLLTQAQSDQTALTVAGLQLSLNTPA